MALYEVTGQGLRQHEPVDFATVEVRERQDLQRLLRDDISVLDEDLLVVAEEYGQWEQARRRIDLLALDRNGQLVVIELKRTDDAGHAELQSLRYAAMVSAMTFEEVVEAYTDHLEHHHPDEELDARSVLAEFLEADPDSDPEDLLTSDVRIVLVAAGFGREISTTVLWLNEFEGMDIRCVRLTPYEVDSRILVDLQQIIPLPEAADYQVQVKRKDAERQRARRAEGRDFTRYEIVVNGHSLPDENKRNAIRVMVEQLVAQGVDPAHLVPIVRKSKLLELDGEHRDQESVKAALLERYPETRVKRYFTEHPIVSHGKTFVLSKMWGRQTERTLRALVETYPETKVSFRPVQS